MRNRSGSKKILWTFTPSSRSRRDESTLIPALPRSPTSRALPKRPSRKNWSALYRTFVGSGNPFILPPGTPKDRVKILQDAMRKTYKDAEFFKEYTKLTGLKAEPQMPEELEQTIKDMPRDREAVELFKKLTGPDPLPQR